MQAALDIADFRNHPAGRYLAGATWLHFCANTELFGVVLWGHPSREDVEALVRSLRIELDEHVARHQSLVDASRVEGADAGAFTRLHDYVLSHREDLTERVSRLALVRPNSTFAGAVVSGFFDTLIAPYPVQVFPTSLEALQWLTPDHASPVNEELERLYATIAGDHPAVSALRGILGAQLCDIDVRRAARTLHMSPRTLQRRLQEAGTSFQDVLTDTRIRVAKHLMLTSDAPLSRIAVDVGFGSVQHFGTRFREHVGVSPSQWRRDHRSE